MPVVAPIGETFIEVSGQLPEEAPETAAASFDGITGPLVSTSAGGQTFTGVGFVAEESVEPSEAASVDVDSMLEEGPLLEEGSQPCVTVPLHHGQVAMGAETDQDEQSEQKVIVIDDDQTESDLEEEAAHLETFPVLPVRRHEYGQLFAKLRRG